MQEHLYALLSGAVSFTVAWGSLGSGVGLPRASIFRTSGARDMHLQGTGLMQTRVQIDCYGATVEDAHAAESEIRSVLEGYRGGPILGIFLEAVRDGFEDDTQLLQRVSLTFAVRHRD
ncbi:hypothetical protein [Alloyangia pacifica]|uniref:DUF3168 domain-containing protein n=2 Tax=Alloyangia pacifica TaxID=311180 RepID=A0A1I6QK66_9RHOB|nr:hypothetical protein [Alloyangia pacifica]SDF91442.1 hypothetical protein SAMN04488245_101118 [Alloyangia pacifica]SFS52678.1 hypothetical protein SAMN04488050_102119 [Alloyangia pacifica]